MKLEIFVDGRQVEWLGPDGEAQAVEPGVYSVIIGGHSYDTRVARAGDAFQVDVDGRRFRIEIRDPRSARRAGGSGSASGARHVQAPMPGKVVRLLVAEGDPVAAGQGLIVVEAMKMQNEMKSPKDGRVAKLLATEGATVGAGDVLATIE